MELRFWLRIGIVDWNNGLGKGIWIEDWDWGSRLGVQIGGWDLELLPRNLHEGDGLEIMMNVIRIQNLF